MSKKKPVSKSADQTSKIKTINMFPIVGIGASAGGLEALEQFFGNMSSENGMAFVVIQHLDPHHVGIMPELLQRITSMKVEHAREVLRTLVYNEEAWSTSDGKWFNIRIMPYRTLNDLIDGLVIAFNDITIAKQLKFQLKEANEILIKKRKGTS